MAAHELPSNTEIPYVPFPENPKEIKVGKFKVHEYIPPTKMEGYVERLAEKIDFENYEEVLVNLKGGSFLFEWIARIKGYKHEPAKIEYHRPPNAYGAIVETPVSAEFKDKKVLVIDDIYDSGGVFQAIMKRVGPSSQAVALITKNGIPNQIQIPNLTIGLKIDNVWIGGCGMDLGVPEEEDTFRSYPGIVVKKDTK